jgi:allophanate hydrolase subunit 1
LQPPSRLYDVTSQNYAVVTFDILLFNEAVRRKEFPNFFEVCPSLPSLILIVQKTVCSLQLLESFVPTAERRLCSQEDFHLFAPALAERVTGFMCIAR